MHNARNADAKVDSEKLRSTVVGSQGAGRVGSELFWLRDMKMRREAKTEVIL